MLANLPRTSCKPASTKVLFSATAHPITVPYTFVLQTWHFMPPILSASTTAAARREIGCPPGPWEEMQVAPREAKPAQTAGTAVGVKVRV